MRYGEIDDMLMQYLQEKRSAGVRVTGKALKYEALRLHKNNGSQSFKASCGWFRSFKKRHNISFRRATHISQQSKAVTDDRVDKFLSFVLRMRRHRQYHDRGIGNMDETPVWLEMPGTTTLEKVGADTVSVASAGKHKMRYTAKLAAFADGTKLPVLVLLPGVRPPKKDIVPHGIIIHMCGTGRSWSNAEITKVWLNRIWGRNNTEKRMLVWDTFTGHTKEDVKELVRKEFNTDIAYIPGGCTSLLQPADVSWNRPFKAKIQEMYDEWMFSGEHTFTAKGNLRAPTVADLLGWIKAAWDGISPDIIRKSFKKCGITNALDGTEDDLFATLNDSEDDPFEDYDPEEVALEQDFHDNIVQTGANQVDQLTLSDDDVDDNSSDEDSDYDDYYDVGSPGH